MALALIDNNNIVQKSKKKNITDNEEIIID